MATDKWVNNNKNQGGGWASSALVGAVQMKHNKHHNAQAELFLEKYTDFPPERLISQKQPSGANYEINGETYMEQQPNSSNSDLF